MHRHSNHPAARRGVRILVALLAFASLTSCDSDTTTEPSEREVLLGGLFSLTGSWSTLGQTGQAAMELAVDDVNQYLARNAAGIRFVAAIEDTKLDPQIALEKAQALHARGVPLLIGPQSSSEVGHLKPFVDANGLLLVSPSSTAGSLAIAGDNVFRFTPGDSLEGAAISAMMWEDGMRAIIPVWRDDTGNSGFEQTTRASFGALGGAVLQGVKYGAAAADFNSTLASVGAQVRQAIEQHGTGQVALYLAAFDEVASLFTGAAADPTLSSVRWYGSDGVVQSDALIEPDAFALAVYDAVRVLARGYVASGATLSIEELKQAFTTAASTHFGATGWTVLNAAGDRKYGDFDFWGVREVGDGLGWTRVARYETRTRRLVR